MKSGEVRHKTGGRERRGMGKVKLEDLKVANDGT